MATARDIIKDALRKIHVLGKGSSLDADEANDALSILNDMLASWSAEGNLVFVDGKQTFTLTGALSYTIGEGLDFNTPAPLYISSAYTSQGEIDYPMEEYDNDQYSAIPQKNIGGISRVFYYDNNYPTATIYLYPVPAGVTTITLNTFSPLSSFTTLDTDFAMPPEYKAALVYNLARWVASEYEREAAPEVKRIAAQTKKTIQVQNNRNQKHTSSISVPTGKTRGYDRTAILRGQ